MLFQKKKKKTVLAILLTTSLLFSACLTSKKMDKFVAAQYNNEFPKQDKRKNPDITVASSISSGSADISTSNKKTSHVLPLLFYWQWDYRHTCTLNPAIAVTNFTNTLYLQANKGLNQKLNGEKLELTIEQVPNAFALVDKAHLVWLIYAFSWDKLYVEPDFKDLIVSFKVLQNGNEVKSGKIEVKNTEQNRGIRFFQSWKSATSEYLAEYNQHITTSAKTFVNRLIEEL